MRAWCFFILLALYGVPASAQKKIHFAHISWYEAIAEVKQSDKFLFFYISQPGCDYCREFDKVTLKNPEIRELLQSRFIAVKHSVRTPYGEAFARDFHLTHTPAVLLLNPRRSEKPVILGEIYDVNGFLKGLRKWLNEEPGVH